MQNVYRPHVSASHLFQTVNVNRIKKTETGLSLVRLCERTHNIANGVVGTNCYFGGKQSGRRVIDQDFFDLCRTIVRQSGQKVPTHDLVRSTHRLRSRGKVL